MCVILATSFFKRFCHFVVCLFCFFFSSRRRHTRCALVTGVQTCALPISCSARVGLIDPLRLADGAARGRPLSRISARIAGCAGRRSRSEEHTSELQSLMRISYAVFCLKKKKNKKKRIKKKQHTNSTILPEKSYHH